MSRVHNRGINNCIFILLVYVWGAYPKTKVENNRRRVSLPRTSVNLYNQTCYILW